MIGMIEKHSNLGEKANIQNHQMAYSSQANSRNKEIIKLRIIDRGNINGT